MSHVAALSAFAEAVADPLRPLPAGVTCHRGAPDAARFAVYRNNVHAGLVTALAGRFPVTAALVGEDFFRAMARVYVGGRKPASPRLFEYGDDFPDFVAAFPPAADLAYLADVARLEVAWARAYAAADVPPLAVGALAALPADRLGDIRFHPHPAAALVISPHPVAAIWRWHQEPGAAEAVADGAESVLVGRPGAEVELHLLPAPDAAFAAALLAGADIATAATVVATPDFDPGAALVGLVGLGTFVRALLPETLP